jgi:hypothetical protein
MRVLHPLALFALLLLVACRPTPGSHPTPMASTPTPMSPAAPSATLTTTSTPTPSVIPSQPTVTLSVTSTPSPIPSSGRVADANVLYVEAERTPDGSWTFYVTVEHPDIGWEDYADGWDIATPGGTVIKPDPDSPFTRLLLHPHVNEQPFTRSQSGIVIPPDVTQVLVRAHDLIDGYGGRQVLVDLTASSGTDFEIRQQ